MSSLDADRALVADVLANHGSAGDAFAERFRNSLVNWLCSKCDPSDGRSREKAVDLVDQLLAECVSGDPAKNKPPLLTKYSGKGSLEGWLRRSVRCRLISWWRSLEYRSEQSASTLAGDEDDDSNPLETRFAGEDADPTEQAIAEMLRDALVYGFDRAEVEEPLGLVFLRLASLYGVQKQRLAQAWQRDPAQAGRRIAKALDIVRSSAQDYVAALDPFLDLEWEDYLRVFQEYPRLLHGEREPA